MAWETRARGGRYYTRSRRASGRCVREYVGTGHIAVLAAQLDLAERAKRLKAWLDQRATLDAFDASEASINSLIEGAESAARLLLSAAGYRQHRGQWRRKRG